MEWLDNRIQIIPPAKPKKLTGTRFAAVMGLNEWCTPFETWCAVTRTYEKPFTDTKYTIAGKTIEPKQAAYMKRTYFMDNIISPSDVYGDDYFKKTWGDFFPDVKVFGGSWDYLLVDENGKPKTVLEMKTTSRVESWKYDIPEYYALQAALYAYLLGVDDVIMVASFLEESDYAKPDAFVCKSTNTVTRPFKLSERYPNFEHDYVKPALKWWKDHVESGLSPEYDERKDAEILKALRTNNVTPETDLQALIDEAETIKARLDANAAQIAADEKRYKVLLDMVKQMSTKKLREGDNAVQITGKQYTFELSKSSTTKIDKDALERDGLLEKYSVSADSYRLNVRAAK